MSADGIQANFIKYSTPSDFDTSHYNYKLKRKSIMIKFLAVVCFGLVLVLFLHEGYHYRKSCGNGETVIEKISVISFETVPVPVVDDDDENFGDKKESTGEIISNDESDQVCKPGSTKRMDCNTCICNEEGTSYGCTKMACLTKQLDTRCDPGSTKMMDCNACTCNEEGTGFGCTKMACNGIHLDFEQANKNSVNEK